MAEVLPKRILHIKIASKIDKRLTKVIKNNKTQQKIHTATITNTFLNKTVTQSAKMHDKQIKQSNCPKTKQAIVQPATLDAGFPRTLSSSSSSVPSAAVFPIVLYMLDSRCVGGRD